MTAPRRSRPQRAPGRSAGPSLEKAGSVRRAQMITTYGVGSMIAIEDASYIVSGLEDWRINKLQQVHEPRLQRALGVAELYLPPAEDNWHGAALRRFPFFYSCQNCTLLQPYNQFGRKGTECACGGMLIPSRFVLACEDGHLSDFPYRQWVHRGAEDGDGSCRKDLRMITTGRTASLRSIEIQCGCGRNASMEGAFRRSELRKLNIRCPGIRPWLRGEDAKTDCTKLPRTMQRGSSAAWFGVVRSSLAIPPWSNRLQQTIDPYYDMWKGMADEVIAKQAEQKRLLTGGITAQRVIDAVRRREQLEALGQSGGVDLDMDLKAEEYEQLGTPTPEDDHDKGNEFECRTADGPSPRPEIEQIMQVTRLREVRVLESFTRVEPPTMADAEGRRAKLSTGAGWLPAMEVVGEGVFLRLSNDKLHAWEARTDVQERAGMIIGNHQRLLERRAEAAGRQAPASHLTARTILIHTLAHALINEWSLDSGYSASAMRERLYTADDMAGLLIYTATSDSAGSLGGIVRQGEPDKLARTLTSALQRAQWCSADPLCMESDGSGSDSLNLAACHVCSLLPETSCELNNTVLDRGLLIGWPEQPRSGFFQVG